MFFEFDPVINRCQGLWRQFIRGFAQEIHHGFRVFSKSVEIRLGDRVAKHNTHGLIQQTFDFVDQRPHAKA